MAMLRFANGITSADEVLWAALAVEFVDKGDDRHVARAADLEELAGLLLDALGGVQDHHCAVDRGQRAVGVP
jgi:hypothetical protein